MKFNFIRHSFFRCQTGGHLLLARPARLARSAATLLLLAARRAGIFCLPGPPVWPVPPQPCSSSLPDGRASSACPARPSGPFRRNPAPPRCQTGGHLLLARPARLARSAATLLLLAARRAGIFCLPGPPVWPVPPQPCSSSLPDGRASSACPARPSGPFRRNPAPPRCQTGGHLLLARPARLARSAATLLLLAARRAGIFCLPGPPVWPVPCNPAPPRCQTGGHLLLARPARLARSAATLLLLAARRAGIFCLPVPPVWPVPPQPCSSSLPDGRASSACPARPSGPFRATLLLLAARRAGIFCLPGPPVWPVPPQPCSSSLPDGRASSACPARPSGPFRRNPAPPRCQTGGHLLLARPARLARSAATLLLLAARRAGIFCLPGPPVWPVPPQPCSSSLPDGRASSACPARPSGPFRRNPAPPRCQTGGHLLLARPSRLARSAATLLLLAARRAGIFCLPGPPVWPVPPQPCSSSLPDGRASSACPARPSGPFRRNLLLLAARRAGIFCWPGPPVWPVPPQPCSSSLPDGRASSACPARPSGPFIKLPCSSSLPDGRASSGCSTRPSGSFRR